MANTNLDTEFESQCVHCGLCLDACPTYRLTGLEAESPRGRLYLMAAAGAADENLDTDTARHLDSCLGCLACETACPSGVEYGLRIEAFRPRVAASMPWSRRMLARVLNAVSRRGSVLRLAVSVARILDRLRLERWRRRLPGLGLMPSARGRSASGKNPGLPALSRVSAAVVPGCGVAELRPSILEAANTLLRRNGFGAVEIGRKFCCGALDLHSGNPKQARRLARALAIHLAATNTRYVVTCTAGCGALLRHYDDLLADDPVAVGAARWVAHNTRDISELLVESGLDEPTEKANPAPLVAYHDACHLVHAAGIAAEPRAVLRASGAQVIDLGENGLCCGSAGSYGLLHAGNAERLGLRKAQLAAEVGAKTIAVGNIGCILQIERALALAGQHDVTVCHPIELLAEAYRNESSVAHRRKPSP